MKATLLALAFALTLGRSALAQEPEPMHVSESTTG